MTAPKPLPSRAGTPPPRTPRAGLATAEPRRQWEYTLPLPRKGSGTNARGHWSQRDRFYREECTTELLQQPRPDAPLERVRIEVELRVCRKSLRQPQSGASADEYQAWLKANDRYRPRDRENFVSAIKGGIDALQPAATLRLRSGKHRHLHGAGVIVADDEKHADITWRPIAEVASFAEEGVWVWVEELVN